MGNRNTDLLDPEPDTVALETAKPSSIVGPDTAALMFERLAKDPTVDVDKLERLMAMFERGQRSAAEAAFNVAFAAMLPEIPTIEEKGRTDKTSYAPLEDIIEPIRPVLSRHGFSLSFRTEWPEKGLVRIVGILTHEQGHARMSEFISAADQTGSKNAIQALGSTVSYGKRYTTKDLLCIVTRGQDDDAERSEGRKKTNKEQPPKYEEWLDDLEAVADEGMPKFAKMWNDSPDANRKYLTATEPKRLASIRTKAERATPQGARR